MTTRLWPISRAWSRLFGALVLISAALLFSSQLALAQFTQQGPKLVGTGDVGGAQQGYSVALSADGNTAIVGGPADTPDSACRCSAGAAWVFTRSSGAWAQQKAENHAHMMALYFMHYNFVRIHQTLKITPAMAAGVSTKLWEMSDMVTVLEDWEVNKLS